MAAQGLEAYDEGRKEAPRPDGEIDAKRRKAHKAADREN